LNADHGAEGLGLVMQAEWVKKARCDRAVQEIETDF
jgi:hypothetical protein